MRNGSLLARVAVGTAGGLLLAGTWGAAALAVPAGSGDVDVDVVIEPEAGGALTLTVAGTSTSLTEGEGTADYREFTGGLPEVTVTDTRSAIAPDVFWSVTGQASPFSADGVPDLSAEHLGWTPNIVTDNDGEVAVGGDVPTVIDDPTSPGLSSQSLLYLALDSTEARATGSWTADAGLVFKTPIDVPAGSYTSVLTLSLFEDVYTPTAETDAP